MNFLFDSGPIIACSTGIEVNTAIGILRLSGFKNLNQLQKFFSFNLSLVKERQAHLTFVRYEEMNFDQGLLTYFPEKRSFTGENVLELALHGNQINLRRIIDLFVHKGGFRLAYPGEFTFRALKNKKLNLSQVEGLDLLINANSEYALNQGLGLMHGDLSLRYKELYQLFIKLKASLELSIDFSDDVGEEQAAFEWKSAFAVFFQKLGELYKRTQGQTADIFSPEVVLVGETNAGKSSLFNLLCSLDRSIVSSTPGTTRDYISEPILASGVQFKLIDTAGVRDSIDEIERVGIDRAMAIVNRAFFKILLINPFSFEAKYLERLSAIKFDIIMMSHSDLSGFEQALDKLSNLKTIPRAHSYYSFSNLSGSIEPLKRFIQDGSIGPLGQSGSIEPLSQAGSIGPKTQVDITGSIGPDQSFLSDSGSIEPLLKRLFVEKYRRLTNDEPIILERHRLTIRNAFLTASNFRDNYLNGGDVAIVSSELRLIERSLSELIGIVSPDDVLNSIFSNFCIGK